MSETKKRTTRKATIKQRKFVEKYLEGENATQAALEVYDTNDYSTAGNIASDNLKKPKVIALLESESMKSAMRVAQLRDQDKNLPVALSAARDILDRAGYKAPDKTELSIKKVDYLWD